MKYFINNVNTNSKIEIEASYEAVKGLFEGVEDIEVYAEGGYDTIKFDIEFKHEMYIPSYLYGWDKYDFEEDLFGQNDLPVLKDFFIDDAFNVELSKRWTYTIKAEDLREGFIDEIVEAKVAYDRDYENADKNIRYHSLLGELESALEENLKDRDIDGIDDRDHKRNLKDLLKLIDRGEHLKLSYIRAEKNENQLINFRNENK